MCRSIKRLREGEQLADELAIREAARQFVRKVSGFQKPTARHQDAFEQAVDEVSATTRRLLEAVQQQLAKERA
jgi:hypothetical protein